MDATHISAPKALVGRSARQTARWMAREEVDCFEDACLDASIRMPLGDYESDIHAQPTMMPSLAS